VCGELGLDTHRILLNWPDKITACNTVSSSV
jgi:hypothetical protein